MIVDQYHINLGQLNGLVLSIKRFTEIDQCNSFHVPETQIPSAICCPTILNGNVNIYLYVIIHYAIKEIDCTR